MTTRTIARLLALSALTLPALTLPEPVVAQSDGWQYREVPIAWSDVQAGYVEVSATPLSNGLECEANKPRRAPCVWKVAEPEAAPRTRPSARSTSPAGPRRHPPPCFPAPNAPAA